MKKLSRLMSLSASRSLAEWLHLEMAEIIVFQTGANGVAQPVARIPLERWAELGKSALP